MTQNASSSFWVSSGHTLKAIVVHTLPNTAFKTDSSLVFWLISWAIYWWAIVSHVLYFLASDNILSNSFVIKFWNSSTYI